MNGKKIDQVIQRKKLSRIRYSTLTMNSLYPNNRKILLNSY